ncbi:MAG: hypothetical protein ABI353_17735 [Isosphaeraceae bacterium]
MPFAVFRRHQKQLIVTFAMLAMLGFVLADSLPALMGGGGGMSDNPVEATLYGKAVRRADLARLTQQRNVANAFIGRLIPDLPQPFGGTSSREIIDALILEHEANRLGIPATAEFGNTWLVSVFGNALSPDLFEKVLRDGFERMSGQEMLETIAGQVRLLEVRRLPGPPTVTPLDVYQTYKDQHERVSAVAVPFPVADFLSKAAEPTEDQVRAYYEKYKDDLPDPNSPNPGFKLPHRARIEFVSLDGATLTREVRAALTEKELRATYTQRPQDFPAPEPELPVQLFAGDPEARLTPLLRDPFLDARPLVEQSLAEEKARNQVEESFDKVRAVMDPFSDKYLTVIEENQDAKAERKAQRPLPTPGDLVKQAAAKAGLPYEASPLLTRELAGSYSTIGEATVGSTPSSGSRTFVDAFFDSKVPVYDPVELIDSAGRHYLAWKLDDQPPRVPSLDQIHGEVVNAWKREQARPLAEGAAQTLADQAKAKEGDLRAVAEAEKKAFLVTDLMTRFSPSIMISPSQIFPSRLNEIPQIPEAGETLRDVLFDLKPKQAAVASNAPKTVYYALALDRRVPADFNQLYDPFGQRMSVQNEAMQKAQVARDKAWMDELRSKAGLPADWVPTDESKDEDQAI